MNELQVIVQQEPGEVHWNFEDLKTALHEEMKTYQSMIYDDGSIKTAKSDVAMLRKLKKAVEDKRKEIKNKCLEPYTVIENQAKELNALIDGPIETISAQVSDYEKKQREAKRIEIEKYAASISSNIPQDIAQLAFEKAYDHKWENATAKKTDWITAIDAMYKKVSDDLHVLQRTELNQDYLNIAINIYKQNLDIVAAMDKLNELHAQEKLMLERQRQKEEAEAVAAHNVEEKQAAPQASENYAQTTQYSELRPSTEPEPAKSAPRTVDNGYRYQATITLYAQDQASIDRIVDYVKFMGVQFEVRQDGVYEAG